MCTSRLLSGFTGHRSVIALVAATLTIALSPVASAAEVPPIPEAPEPIDTPAGAIDVGEILPSNDNATTAGGRTEMLLGRFELAPGSCDGPSGTYFRMVQPDGDPDSGPFVPNNDSPCSGDDTVTTLRPGTDGGLTTGSYQPHPNPAFNGNAGLASRITQPQSFFGTDFAVATNPTDPQTGTDVPAPTITVDGAGNLSGDLRAFGAAWQAQHFNQGSPKPDRSTGDGTAPVSGTYDRASGRFVIEWTSRIQGGFFNNFTGVWHLEGTFRSGGAGALGSTNTGSGLDAAGLGSGTGNQSQASGSTTASGSTGTTSRGTATGDLANTGGGSLSPFGLGILALVAATFALRRRVIE